MQAKEIKCPQCGRLTFYSPENAFRPFCSDRCKLIDLGQWANEDFKIPAQAQAGYTEALNPEDFNLSEVNLNDLNPDDDENL